MIGIYALTNENNGKTYVGSSKNIVHRLNRHFRRLAAKTHCNTHLQAAYDLGDDFDPQILEECSEEVLIEREQHWIDTLETRQQEKGYNRTIAGRTVLSPEEYRRIGDLKQGKTIEELWGVERATQRREELRAQVGELNPNWGNRGSLNPNFGKTEIDRFGPEKAAQLAAQRSARTTSLKRSEETCQKLSDSRQGMVLSEEHKENIGKSLRAYWATHEREPLSLESRNQIGRTLIEYWKTHPHSRQLPPKLCKRCETPLEHRGRVYCPKCASDVNSERMTGNTHSPTKPSKLCACGAVVPKRSRKLCDECLKGHYALAARLSNLAREGK